MIWAANWPSRVRFVRLSVVAIFLHDNGEIFLHDSGRELGAVARLLDQGSALRKDASVQSAREV